MPVLAAVALLPLASFRLALEFLLDFIDPDVGLLSVPGSLFIDTFIRQHYTTDSNAAMVLLLERFIDAESFVGNSTGVAALGKIRERIITQMNALLWDGTGRAAAIGMNLAFPVSSHAPSLTRPLHHTKESRQFHSRFRGL